MIPYTEHINRIQLNDVLVSCESLNEISERNVPTLEIQHNVDQYNTHSHTSVFFFN